MGNGTWQWTAAVALDPGKAWAVARPPNATIGGQVWAAIQPSVEVDANGQNQNGGSAVKEEKTD
eukprot:7674790-Alexandrium_andersonii.AAC.1